MRSGSDLKLEALDAILRSNDLVAVLGREVPVRLVDISSSGCLLESGSRLEKGTTGSLRVVYEGQEYSDDVGFKRCRTGGGSRSVFFRGGGFPPVRDRNLVFGFRGRRANYR